MVGKLEKDFSQRKVIKMCTVVIAKGLSVAASLWGAYQQNRNLNAQANIVQQQADSQARVLEYNAAQARADAERVTGVETEADLELRQRQRAVRGSQAAVAGASGAALTGDYLNIALGTAVTQEQDLSALRKNYANQRMQFYSQAQSSDFQAASSRIAGRNQASALRSQSSSGLLGSLLTAGGTLAGNWNDIFKKK